MPSQGDKNWERKSGNPPRLFGRKGLRRWRGDSKEKKTKREKREKQIEGEKAKAKRE